MPNRPNAEKIARQVVASYSLPTRGRANHRIMAPLVTAVRLGHEAGCACVLREDDAMRIAGKVAGTVDTLQGRPQVASREDLQTIIFDGIRDYFEEYNHG